MPACAVSCARWTPSTAARAGSSAGRRPDDDRRARAAQRTARARPRSFTSRAARTCMRESTRRSAGGDAAPSMSTRPSAWRAPRPRAGAAHFVFASSVKVNGEATLPGRPFRESDPPDPHDDYAASKWEAEQRARRRRRGNRDAGHRAALAVDVRTRREGQFRRLARAIARGVPLPLAGIDNRRSLLGAGNCGARDRGASGERGPDRARSDDAVSDRRRRACFHARSRARDGGRARRQRASFAGPAQSAALWRRLHCASAGRRPARRIARGRRQGVSRALRLDAAAFVGGGAGRTRCAATSPL